MTPAMMMANMGRSPITNYQIQPLPSANVHQQYQQPQQQYQSAQYPHVSMPAANYGQQMAYNMHAMPGMMQMMSPMMMMMPAQGMGNITSIQGMSQKGVHIHRMNGQQAPPHQKNGKKSEKHRGGNKNNNSKYGPGGAIDDVAVYIEACPTKKELKALKRAENLKEVQMYCDNCEKELKTKEAWDAHLKTHEKCRYEGCDFMATRKVVDTHYRNVHGASTTDTGTGTDTDTGTGYKIIDVEGQKFRVLFGTTESEIKQWREARKKKFPTAGNIAAKEEAKRKAIEAGTLDVFMNGKKKQKIEERERVLGDDVEDAMRPLETNESTNGGADSTKNVTVIVDESDDADENVVGVKDSEKGEAQNDGENHTTQEANATSMEDAIAVSTSDQKDSNTISNKANVKKRKQSGKLHLPKPLGGGTRGTLLKKLLEDEIDKESNIVLQCFRFFSANNWIE